MLPRKRSSLPKTVHEFAEMHLGQGRDSYRNTLTNEVQPNNVDELKAKIIKLEEEAERQKHLIQTLDERAGAAVVESNSSGSEISTTSIPTVRNEITQQDVFFAKNYKYTTNVSFSRNLFIYFEIEKTITEFD